MPPYKGWRPDVTPREVLDPHFPEGGDGQGVLFRHEDQVWRRGYSPERMAAVRKAVSITHDFEPGERAFGPYADVMDENGRLAEFVDELDGDRALFHGVTSLPDEYGDTRTGSVWAGHRGLTTEHDKWLRDRATFKYDDYDPEEAAMPRGFQHEESTTAGQKREVRAAKAVEAEGWDHTDEEYNELIGDEMDRRNPDQTAYIKQLNTARAYEAIARSNIPPEALGKIPPIFLQGTGPGLAGKYFNPRDIAKATPEPWTRSHRDQGFTDDHWQLGQTPEMLAKGAVSVDPVVRRTAGNQSDGEPVRWANREAENSFEHTLLHEIGHGLDENLLDSRRSQQAALSDKPEAEMTEEERGAVERFHQQNRGYTYFVKEGRANAFAALMHNPPPHISERAGEEMLPIGYEGEEMYTQNANYQRGKQEVVDQMAALGWPTRNTWVTPEPTPAPERSASADGQLSFFNKKGNLRKSLREEQPKKKGKKGKKG